ncbi:MAG TPA: universal stress protein [Solirubrobacterales bacterium]|nr:universal stress protein [Solirubrobacterales bacterium]
MARRIPRDESLARVHGTGALFSAAYGNVGSSIYYALGVTAAFALGLTPAAFIITGLIFMCTAATYVEATVMYPEAGGSSSFARHAFNELVSFLAAWGQMLNYIITVAISAFFVPHYLGVFWEPLGEGPGDVIGGIVLIAALAALNVKGTEESSRFNLILAVADLATQVVLVIIGFALVFNAEILVENVDFGVAPTLSDFALGIAVGMIAYTGIETISNMAGEAKDAAKTVPQGTGLTVLAVFGLYALLPLVALSAMPVTQDASGAYTTELGTTFADDPVLGIVENLGLGAGLTDAMRVYVGILAAVILVIATNAALIGVSRLTYSMGQYRQLPEGLRQIHRRFRTPYVAILVFSGVAMITLIPGETELLATLYSFGAMLSFTIAHVSLIRLRQKYPDMERPWRPMGTVRALGFDLPLTAVVGGLGTFTAWIVVMALNPRTLAIGAVWMGLGITLYFVYRRLHGISPSETHKVLLPEGLGVEEIEYQSVLVAFEDDAPFSEETVATAAKLAAKRRRGIHVVSVLTVPQSLPLDAPVPERESEAQSKIEQAKLIGGLRVTGHVHRVRPNQAGHSIAEEAEEMQASALVVGLRYRDGRPLYGKTLQTILAERPCRIIVVGEPSAARSRAGATERVGAPA